MEWVLDTLVVFTILYVDSPAERIFDKWIHLGYSVSVSALMNV